MDWGEVGSALPGGKSRMKNQKEKDNRISHFCGLGNGQSLFSGPKAEGTPLMMWL